MIDTAIVVCPQDGLREEALLGLDVAGLGLLTRSLLTARKAGIGRLVLVASSALLSACVHAARTGRAGLERFGGQLRSQGQLQVAPWEGMDPETIGSAADVPAVERRLLRAQRSAEDGPIVDRFLWTLAISCSVCEGDFGGR
jgi:hypothetical protein